MNLRIYITALLCSATLAVSAQKRWTLDECVSYAVENNLQVKNLNYTKDTNRESYRQSVRALLPNFSGFSEYRYNTG